MPDRSIFCSALALAGALLCLTMAAAQASDPAPLASQSLLLTALKIDGQMIAAGERGHILLSSDGREWQQASTTPGQVLLTTLAAAGPVLLAGGHDATILRSTDRGRSWTQVFSTRQLPPDDPARDAPLLGLTCLSASRCHGVGAYGLFLSSTDGGASWYREYVKEDDRNFYALDVAPDGGLLLAGEAGALLHRPAGSDDWTALSSPYEGSFFGLLRTPAGSLLLYGLRGHIFRSTDEGQSWSEIPSGVDSGLMGAAVLGDGRIVIVGAAGTVLLSSDDGASFTLSRQRNRKALGAVLATPDGRLLGFGEAGVDELELTDADR